MIPSDDHDKQQKCHDFKICCDDQKAHASVYDLDLFADLDANSNPQSSFSIRNYVFDSRSKNIACNWPFSDKTLKICLQHEVKNILPPFQSLESPRNISSDEKIMSSCNGISKSNPELTLESKESIKCQTDIQQGLGQTKSKKPVLGSFRKTETETTMGSKICPVCKVFSSSSNTTLNAHIDQCLSGGSTMKWTASPEAAIKHRIKHRKMRLMVDIYKTAPHCTVEELDARNGTFWANNSSFPNQDIEVQGEQEKETPAETTIVDHEGDVYIKNNRTKVRILSIPKADDNTSNDDGTRKNDGKSFLVKKKRKNHEPKHDQKYLKQSPNSKRSSSEVAAGRDENVNNGGWGNKEAVDKDDSAIVRPPWACSKRSGLATMNLSVAGDTSFLKSGFKPPSSSSNKMGTQSQQKSRKMGTLTPKKVHVAQKRSLATKPSSKHLKKRDTVLQHSCEDPSDLCRVKGSDVRSKGSKLSSSRDNLLSVIRKTAYEINLKRKFSAGKRLQDSMKEKSGVKEDTDGKTSCESNDESAVKDVTGGKTSYESMNVLEVKKNEKVEICRPENSVSSRSLNEGSSRLKTCMVDPSCDVESVGNEARLNKEQASAMQVPSLSDKMFDSRERVIDVTDDFERQQHYHDMSDSPVSTISNPSLTRSESDKFSVRSTPGNDEKDALVTLTNSGDWRSKGQSQTTSFKYDHQPCCCSRKETASSQALASTYHDQSTLLRKHDVESFNFGPKMFSISNFPTSPPPPLLSPPMKLPPYRESDNAASPSKPVIRLMGKNLTVVNTDEDKVNCSQFSNGYQDGFKSQHTTFHPPNSLISADYYVHGSPHAGPMLLANHDPKDSLPFNNGGFQACAPFMEVENTMNLAKWNCNSAGSSRSSAIYYPSSF